MFPARRRRRSWALGVLLQVVMTVGLWISDRTVCMIHHKQTDRSSATSKGVAVKIQSTTESARKAVGLNGGDDLIKPEFTTLDGLMIRYATSPKQGAEIVVLLS